MAKESAGSNGNAIEALAVERHIELIQALGAFREEWAKGHAELSTWLESQSQHIEQIDEHLAKLNGSVGTLFEGENQIRADLAKHGASCALWERVDTIELKLAGGEYPGSKTLVAQMVALTSRLGGIERLTRWLPRAAWVIGVALAGLLLVHLAELARYWEFLKLLGSFATHVKL